MYFIVEFVEYVINVCVNWFCENASSFFDELWWYYFVIFFFITFIAGDDEVIFGTFVVVVLFFEFFDNGVWQYVIGGRGLAFVLWLWYIY